MNQFGGARETAKGILERLALARDYLASSRAARGYETVFDGVEVYCMFIGYPRSGHSLVGSLLDAHPQAIIAHELDALRFVERGFDRDRLYHLLLENSRRHARGGREWTGYAYEVPGQWQGRFDSLKVIGDKKGGKSTLRLAQNPDLLNKLQKTVATDLKFVHVVRNPYDNVAAMLKRPPEHVSDPTPYTIAEDYLQRCGINAALKHRLGADAVLDVYQETFVEDPKRELVRLCDFLGLEPEEGYLTACASIVFDSPRKSRHDVEWDDASLVAVRGGIERYGFLSGYSFEDR